MMNDGKGQCGVLTVHGTDSISVSQHLMLSHGVCNSLNDIDVSDVQVVGDIFSIESPSIVVTAHFCES